MRISPRKSNSVCNFTAVFVPRKCAQAEPEFVQQAAAQLPWFHPCTLIDKLATREERDWYLAKAIEHNWSRNILVMQIEGRVLERSGTAVTNFEASLPKAQSDLARTGGRWNCHRLGRRKKDAFPG